MFGLRISEPSTRTPVSSELMAGLARTASRMASTSGSARAASRVQGRGDRPAEQRHPRQVHRRQPTARKLGQNAYARPCAIAGPSPLHAAGPLAT